MHYFFKLCSSSSLCVTPVTHMLDLVTIFSYRSLGLCSFFFSIFFCFAAWIIYFHLSSSSLDLSSVTSMLVLIPSSDFFIAHTAFFSSKFVLYFSPKNFYFSINLKHVYLYLMKHVYNSCFKVFILAFKSS